MRTAFRIVVLWIVYLAALQAQADTGDVRLDESETYRQLATHVYLARSADNLPAGVKGRTEFWNRDASTGLDVEVFETNRPDGKTQLVVSFGGTDLLRGMQDGMKDFATDIKQGAPDWFPKSGVEKQYVAALDFARRMQEVARKEGKELLFTGHSLGGGMAQYAAVTLGARAECFSAAPIGEKIAKTITSEQAATADKLIRHFVTPGDPVWFLPNVIRSSQHYGRAYFTPPPRGLDGIIPSDQYVMRSVGPKERIVDSFSRHMAHTEIPLSSVLGPDNGMGVSDALRDRAPIWRAIRDTVPRQSQLETQVAALDRMTANAKRVVIFGEGPDAAELQKRLNTRLGPSNVLRIVKDQTANELYRDTADFHPDVYVGFQDSLPRKSDVGERVLMRAETVKKVVDAAESLAWFGRMAQGLARDPAQLKDPVLQSQAARFHEVFGDSLTHSAVKDALETWGKWDKQNIGVRIGKSRLDFDLSRTDLALSLASDAAAMTKGEWRLEDSHVVGTVVDGVMSKAVGSLGDALFERSKVIPALATYGITPAIKAGWEQHRAGGSWTPDVVEGYLESAVAVTWGGLGYAMTRNPKVAERFASAGVTLGQIGRDLTAAPMNRAAHAKNLSAYYEQWSTEQISLARRTNQSLPTFRDFLADRGVPVDIVGKELAKASDELHLAAVRDQRTRYPGAVPTLVVAPPEPKRITAVSDLDVTRRIVSQGQARIVISDPYRQGEAVCRWAVEQYGKDNVTVIRECHSRYTERRVAGEFGADAIIRVDATKTLASPLKPPEVRIEKPQPPRRDELPPPDPIKPPPFAPPPGGPGGGGMSRELSSPASAIISGGGSWAAVVNRPGTGRIGGVMLDAVARLDASDSAVVGGDFSLAFNGDDDELDVRQLRMFVTAVWAVYYCKEPPGISIDPVARGVEKQLVRYIGRVVNTDLGRVMREADYTMKKWAIGTEKPDIPDFKDVDQLTASEGLNLLGASRRFWFIPEDIRFSRGEGLLVFQSGRMRLKTEYNEDGIRHKAEPADERFADFFTAKYGAIAKKYPIYDELFEYAKMVALARYLKEQGVPLHWFLLANRDLVLTEDSPGTVDTLAKGSKAIEGMRIEGGVEMGIQGRYVFDQETTKAVAKAMAQRRTVEADAPQPTTRPEVVTPTTAAPKEMPSYSLVPQHTLTSGRDRRGLRYQTDIALRAGTEPGLELVRYFRSYSESGGEFGNGWHLMIPYRIHPADKERRKFRNVMAPVRMTVENLLSGQQEVLTLDEERYSIVGYVPKDLATSQVIGLFPLTDATFRLADKLGNELQFDEAGYLTDMILGPEYQVHYEWMRGKTEAIARPGIQLKAVGQRLVKLGENMVPDKVALVDSSGAVGETLVLSDDEAVVGYLPEKERRECSTIRIVAVRKDGAFELLNRDGHQANFTAAGNLSSLVVDGEHPLPAEMSCAKQKVVFRYSLDVTGNLRIGSAEISWPKQDEPYRIRYRHDGSGNLVAAAKIAME